MYGVFFMNILGSFYDDYEMHMWDGVMTVADMKKMWEFFPTYRTVFFAKIFLNLFNMAMALRYMPGWSAYVEVKRAYW